MVSVTDRSEVLDDPDQAVERYLADLGADGREATRSAVGRLRSVLRTEAPAGFADSALSRARLLDALGMDDETSAAAILWSIEQAGLGVGDAPSDGVRRLLDGLARMPAPGRLHVGSGDDLAGTRRQAEQLRKMLLAMAEDIRVVLIRLADRVVRLREASSLPAEERRTLAAEVLEIDAPLANRLGIWQLKWELEDLSLRYLEPELYRRIASLLDERRVDRDRYIERFVERLRDEAVRAGVPNARITGRAKHIYSIWRKMERKQINYHDLYDVRGVRILVDDVQACYTMLGVVHSLWQYIPGEFDDYIATPKENGYRSIHTAVIGPEGKIVEIQIRTHEMHEFNELGVAAHWRYKEGAGDGGIDEKIVWLRRLLDWKAMLAEGGDLVDHFRNDVFADRVYVFTPQGRVIDLPQGATPLDFAYHVHTEIGHRCRGARVNGRLVPLDYTLQTGERVEILTGKEAQPSRDWLNPHAGYLRTPRARSKVQHWFRQLDRGKNIAAGRQIVERELRRLGLSGLARDELAHRLDYTDADELFLAVAQSDCRLSRLASAAQALSASAGAGAESPPPLPVRPVNRDDRASGVRVQGVGNLLTHVARCCRPVPGDEIAGYITVGRGVTVHRRDCANIERARDRQPQRVVELSWGREGDRRYPVDIEIKAFDRQGLLRDIAGVLSDCKVDLVDMRSHTARRGHLARMRMTVEIPDLALLSRIVGRIAQLPNVLDVRRLGD